MRSGRTYPRRSTVSRRTPRRPTRSKSFLATTFSWGWKAFLLLVLVVGGVWLAQRYLHSSSTQTAGTEKKRRPLPFEGDEMKATLYFATADGQWLVPEQRSLGPDQDERAMAARLFESLKDGPVTPGLTATLSPGLQLREIYLAQDGVAIVDLRSPVAEEHLLGVSAEKLTIYSIVNTLVDNLPNVNTVRFLVDGEERDTLMGHLDIRVRFHPSRSLVKKGRS